MGDVVDLAEVGALCVDLTNWWDRFQHDGDATVAELDGLLGRVRALPAMTGPLGSAFTLLERGGVDDTTATVAAMRDIEIGAERFKDTLASHTRGTVRPRRPPATARAGAIHQRQDVDE